MHQNLNGLRISRHDDELGISTIKSLGNYRTGLVHLSTWLKTLCTFIGALAQLFVVRGLLDEVQECISHGCVSKRRGLGGSSGSGI